jgi:hypothetical protein
MVHVDGRVTTCCLDEQLENVVGSLTEQSLVQIWHGPTMNAWRRAHIAGRFEESGPLCTRCNWRSAGAFPADKAAAWLAAQLAKPDSEDAP